MNENNPRIEEFAKRMANKSCYEADVSSLGLTRKQLKVMKRLIVEAHVGAYCLAYRQMDTGIDPDDEYGFNNEKVAV